MYTLRLLTPSQTDAILGQKHVPYPFEPHFLNRIYGDAWRSIAIFQEDALILYLPFFVEKGRSRCASFPLIPFTPLSLSLPLRNPIRKFLQQRSLILLLAKSLKSHFSVVLMNLLPQGVYLTPFSWAGFQLKLRYEFVLKQNQGKVYLEWGSDLRRCIKRAREKGYGIGEPSFEESVSLYQKMLPEIWKRYRPYLTAFFQINDPRVVRIGTYDPQGKLVALGVFLKLEMGFLYNIGVHHREDSYGGAFLLDHAITMAFDHHLDFHFGGSMIASIDHFFGSFGAQPMPFYQVVSKPLIHRLWEQFMS